MTFDPQAAMILKKLNALPALETLSVKEVRQILSKRLPSAVEIKKVSNVRNVLIEAPHAAIPSRLYWPFGEGPFPLVVFFHGGGFVGGDLDTHDSLCRNLCAGAQSIVASVGYRLAPEHRFPAAADDCLFALRWLQDRAREFDADGKRVAVCGDSAGGNLAAVTAIRSMDEGGPLLCAQLLIYPVLDRHDSGAPSYIENAHGCGVSKAAMEWFWAHYLGDQMQLIHPHAMPLRANDLSGLPPTLIVTVESDPLRDEGLAYAQRLRTAGVPISHIHCDGMYHGFILMPGVIDEAARVIEESCEWLRARFGEP